MAAKHPSNKTIAFNKKLPNLLKGKRTGKSNNQLSPHKRWRQSFKSKYAKKQKMISVNYLWYDHEGNDSITGTIVPYKSFIKHKKLFTNTPEFIDAKIINDKTGTMLEKEIYRLEQGITISYQLI